MSVHVVARPKVHGPDCQVIAAQRQRVSACRNLLVGGEPG